MSTGAEQALAVVEGNLATGDGADEATLIGTTLEGAYRITRLIAKGGMSAVYEAVQLRLNQRVAVKVMASELAANTEALARFRREAEITSRLRHPHLVTVTDFGTGPAGQPYLVMEYLEGIDLDQRIRAQGRMPLPMVVAVTKQVASALAAAHEQGIVHRDLKPANVFLVQLPGEPDFAKILDFGISKVRAASTQLTKAQAIIGTPNYMAPEQATGMLDEIDQRTDQWALACIVWEMLAGRAPFASDDMSAVFYQVIHLDPAPLSRRAPEVPITVEAVLRRALSKPIAERFATVRDFASALESAALGGSGSESMVRADGTRQVERRQRRHERRRSDHPSERGRGDAELDAAMQASFGRKSKRAYVFAAAAAAVVLAAVIGLRGNPPAKAAAAPKPAAVVVAPAAPAPAAPVATPPAPASPALAPANLDEAPPKPVPSRPAELAARRPDRHAMAKLVRRADAADPFAPVVAKPTGKRASKAAAEFVDPFAP